ncbi:MAG: SpvB/TcaC N-terminal domain-containing protein [Sumerlaeia bacterium]
MFPKPAQRRPVRLCGRPLGAAVLAMAMAAVGIAPAQDKSGVKPNVLSLPTGAGSVEGLGESFEPQLNSGTGSYSVKIAIPPGRAGFAPGMTLAYNTGAGNSEYGIGWSLAIPMIQRQTDKGLPAYSDADVFLYQGEELARLTDGTWRCENEGSFVRLRREGLGWVATERGGTRHYFGETTRQLRGGKDRFDETFCWHLDRSVDVNGNTIRYVYRQFEDSPGRFYPSRVRYNENEAGTKYFEVSFEYSNPALSSPQTGAVALADWWEAARKTERAEKALQTGYAVPEGWDESFQLAGVDTRPDALSDFRAGFHQRWGRRCSAISVKQENLTIRRYELRYQDEDADKDALQSDLSLLRTVTVFGKNAPPPYDDTNRYRLPTLTFDYTELARPGSAPVFQVRGEPRFPLGDPNTDVLDVNADGLPDIVHIEPEDSVYWLNLGPDLDGTVRFSPEQRLLDVPGGLRLSDPNVQLADFDGDSATDLVHYKGPGGQNIGILCSPARVAENYTDDGFFQNGFSRLGAEQTYTGPAPFALGQPNVQFQDLNFDKFIDVVVSDPFGFTYYLNNEGRSWIDLGSTDFGEAAMANVPSAIQFGTPGVQLADMNGDRLQDLVQVLVDDGRARVTFWHSRGDRRWDLGRVMLGNTFTFSSNVEDLRVMDVNGDGLSDLVALGSGTPRSRLRYWINTGNGSYGAPVTFDERTSQLPAYTAETAIRSADMNGNNMTDLVYANGTRIEFFDFSGGGPKPNMLSGVDNGIGKKVRIDYRSSIDHMVADREAGHPWREAIPMAVPVVTNIITAFGPAFDLNEDGNAWTIEGLEHGFDMDGDSNFDEVYTASIRYHDAYWDPFEKEHRGFRYAEKIEWGDDFQLKWNSPFRTIPDAHPIARVGEAKSVTSVSRFRFHLGDPDGLDNHEYPEPYGGPTRTDERTEDGGGEEESLKGKPLWEETVDGGALADGALIPGEPAPLTYVYLRKEYGYELRRLYGLQGNSPVPAPAFRNTSSTNGRQVTFPMMVATRTWEVEANGYLRERLVVPNGLTFPEKAPVELFSEITYDDYGNAIREANHGIVNDGGDADDERITHRQFTQNTIDWLVDRVFEERVTDESGRFVSMTRTYYDGPPFVGLALGQVGVRGLPTRVEQFINGHAVPASNETIGDEIGDARLEDIASVQASRVAYDAFGNAIALIDPLGVPYVSQPFDAGEDYLGATEYGHVRSVAYDDQYHAFPIEETIHLESPKAPLAMTATYDFGLGVMTTSSDFNGNITEYSYDVFGRLTAIAKPGPDPLKPTRSQDSFDRPTQVFQYIATNPWTGTQLIYDRDGAIAPFPPIAGAPGPLANIVRTFLREDFENGEGYNTLDAFKYTDGLGRTLMEISEPEAPSERLDMQPTGPVVATATRYNLRGSQYTNYIPYFGAESLNSLYFPPPAAAEPGGTARTEIYPDALGRPVRTEMPPEDEGGDRLETWTFNLPRETHSYDEEQSRPGSDHFGAHMEHEKDGLDRLVKVREVVRISDIGDVLPTTDSLRVWQTEYDYDLQDNLIHITDSRGNQKWMRHDGLGRKVFMNDPDRGVLEYEYDDASNLIRTVDAKAQEIRYGYDGANRLLWEDYRDAGQPVSHGRDYDPAQPLGPANRPDVLYHYDAWDGPAIDFGNGRPAGIPANTAGMMVAVEDLTGAETFSYDPRGRVAWRVKAVADPYLDPADPDWRSRLTPFSFVFRYDSMDRVRDMIYPDNDAVHYRYNRRGEIDAVYGGLVTDESPGNPIVKAYDAIPSGQEDVRWLGNDIVSRREYDPRLRMRRLHHTGGYQPGLSVEATDYRFVDYGYSFDGASNILAIADQRPTDPAIAGAVPADSERRNTQHFAYDDLYRLIQVQYPRAGSPGGLGGQIDYRYDRIGNMLAKTTPAPGADGHFEILEDGQSIVHLGTMAYGEGPGPQTGPSGRVGRYAGEAPGPHALTSTASGRSYEYDANGNMTLIEDDTATWDFKDRLYALDDGDRRADYRYDYSDRRISKLVRTLDAQGSVDANQPSTTTLYVDRLFEYREGDHPTKYVFFGDERVARVTGTLAPGRSRVQNLRFEAGWNLATPVVEPKAGLTAANVFGYGTPGSPVSAVFRYDGSKFRYIELQPGDRVVPGEGYWVHSAGAHARSITGAYRDILEVAAAKGSVRTPPGGGFIGWPRLEPMKLTRNLLHARAAYGFDAPTQSFNVLNAPPELAWAFPTTKTIDPGAAFYVRSDAAAVLLTATLSQAAQSIVFPLPDHLGTHQTITDRNGDLVSESAFLPYGSERVSFEASKLDVGFGYQFTQKERDAESGLMYFEARYYLGVAGRFVSTDPIHIMDAKKWSVQNNQYSYARSSPLGLMDPGGTLATQNTRIVAPTEFKTNEETGQIEAYAMLNFEKDGKNYQIPVRLVFKPKRESVKPVGEPYLGDLTDKGRTRTTTVGIQGVGARSFHNRSGHKREVRQKFEASGEIRVEAYDVNKKKPVEIGNIGNTEKPVSVRYSTRTGEKKMGVEFGSTPAFPYTTGKDPESADRVITFPPEWNQSRGARIEKVD